MRSVQRSSVVAFWIVFCLTGCYRHDPLWCETDKGIFTSFRPEHP